MGKGKDPNQEAQDHVSAPLSTLKDPSSFGPPPKHKDWYGESASSPGGSSHSGGLGAPVPREQSSAKDRLQAKREAQLREEEEADKPPPGPYKADTTGLSTAHLPKPPAFRPGQGTPPPPPPARAEGSKPKPSLPPRLPPRQNSRPDAYSQAPPPPYTETAHEADPSQGILNQGALNRLGQAGVSVPGFDINRNASPPVPPRQNSSPSVPISPAAGGNRGPQLDELQSRFARLSTSQNDTQPAKQGTTWAEKQAALKTADNLRNDPSKVSLSDARGATSTANNFRERHGEQVTGGLRAANGLNQKYGIADRMNRLNSPASPPPPALQSPTQTAPGASGKKPPPPPPPKKKNLASPTTGEPPPVPLGSKPKF